MSSSKVVLVAFEVEADSQEEAQERLMSMLPRPTGADGPNGVPGLECWWVAEDDRIDGSDNDSAVFVHPGAQQAAWEALMVAGLTADHNNPRSGSSSIF